MTKVFDTETAGLIMRIDNFKFFEIPHNLFWAKIEPSKAKKKTEDAECLQYALI